MSLAIDGQLEGADVERLETLLREGEREEDFFALMKQHVALGELTAPVRPFSPEELQAISDVEACFAAETEPAASLAARVEQPSPVRGGDSRGRRLVTFLGGLAASLLIMAPLWWVSDPGSDSESAVPPGRAIADANEAGTPSTAEPDANVTTVDYAARIVRKIDCVWGNDRWMISPPIGFREGEWISLSSGLLVLEFSRGATVTLQGPVDAAPLSGNALNLVSGGLSASVPDSARGFTVHTTSGKIIDLGTEFGVLAGSDGSVETHVFEGKVVTQLGKAGEGKPPGESAITAGQAQRVSAAGVTQSLQAQESRFLRFRAGRDAVMAELPPVDQGLVLWLAADGRLQYDESSGVMAWGDNLAGPNQDPEDAWQVHPRGRPTWVSDGINGHPAILFGGNRKLITEPIELGVNVTATVLFRMQSEFIGPDFKKMLRVNGPPEQSRPDLGLQLVNLFGPPHPVLQINRGGELRARMHLGFNPNKIYDNDSGVIDSIPLVDDQPHVAVYAFDSVNKTARLTVDGQLVDEVAIDGELKPTFTPRFIGQHPYRRLHGFPGYIAEVMIHDEALSLDDSIRLSNWLREKYDLPVAPLEAVQ